MASASKIRSRRNAGRSNLHALPGTAECLEAIGYDLLGETVGQQKTKLTLLLRKTEWSVVSPIPCSHRISVYDQTALDCFE